MCISRATVTCCHFSEISSLLEELLSWLNMVALLVLKSTSKMDDALNSEYMFVYILHIVV